MPDRPEPYVKLPASVARLVATDPEWLAEKKVVAGVAVLPDPFNDAEAYAVVTDGCAAAVRAVESRGLRPRGEVLPAAAVEGLRKQTRVTRTPDGGWRVPPAKAGLAAKPVPAYDGPSFPPVTEKVPPSLDGYAHISFTLRSLVLLAQALEAGPDDGVSVFYKPEPPDRKGPVAEGLWEINKVGVVSCRDGGVRDFGLIAIIEHGPGDPFNRRPTAAALAGFLDAATAARALPGVRVNRYSYRVSFHG